MISEQKEKIPKVFISYSHDSPAHKKWVGELASSLVKNGINVILDQWDLGLGDDVPKFMEMSVTEADRVLMICTETYVRKADEGKGGVGYEAMIVTSELVRDLGTSKFIPIIRQRGGSCHLPKSVGTRFYVNLSDDQNVAEQFESLLRELHQAPAVKKPPLGKNPFARQPSGSEIPPSVETYHHVPNVNDLGDDIISIYKSALEIAQRGDLTSWRRIIRQAKNPISEGLSKWRQKYEASRPSTKNNLQGMTIDGISVYAPLMSIALAGLESGRKEFNNQVSLLDEILHPKGWNPNGLTIIVNFPETVAFIYQALHGAMCLHTGQLNIAMNLATARFQHRYRSEKHSVFKIHYLVGWPESLGKDSKIAWDFLMNLPDRWLWLEEPFGEKDDFCMALCAYYFALHILELADTIIAQKETIVKQDEISLEIPIRFLRESDDIVRKAYRLLINDPDQVKAIWRNLGIKDSKMEELWPHWIRHDRRWSRTDYEFGLGPDIIHKDLFEDLR